MAVTSIPTRAPSANPCDTFDPAAWLTRFSDAGGWWIVGADDRISIGWTPRARNPVENADARALWREIEADTGKRWALEQTLIDGAQGLPQGLPTSYAGMNLYLAATQPRAPAPEELVQRGPDADEAWKSAMDAFERADRFEAVFRETVFNPIDDTTPAGDPVGEAVDQAMDAVNDVTDQARRVALRMPAPDGRALRWKIEQFLVEKVMPHPTAREIEQIFADLDRLLAAGRSGVAQAVPPEQAVRERVDHDAAIRAAWARWLALRDAYEATVWPDDCEEPKTIEAPYWKAIGELEQVIVGAKATTPEGISIKLRLALDSTFALKDESDALFHGDYDRLLAGDRDGSEKLFIDILRDLAAMSARLGA